MSQLTPKLTEPSDDYEGSKSALVDRYAANSFTSLVLHFIAKLRKVKKTFKKSAFIFREVKFGYVGKAKTEVERRRRSRS